MQICHTWSSESFELYIYLRKERIIVFLVVGRHHICWKYTIVNTVGTRSASPEPGSFCYLRFTVNIFHLQEGVVLRVRKRIYIALGLEIG